MSGGNMTLIKSAGVRGPPGRHLVAVGRGDVVVVAVAPQSLTVTGTVRGRPHTPGVRGGLVGPRIHLVIRVAAQILDTGASGSALGQHPPVVVVAPQAHVAGVAVAQCRV